MLQPEFGNRFPGTHPGWLPSVSHGRGNPTSANQAPSTLNRVQSTAYNSEQIPAGVTFGQQYNNRLPPAITTYSGQSQAASPQTGIWNDRRQEAPRAQGLNAYAPRFKPRENNRDYYERQLTHLVGGTHNSGQSAHRGIGGVRNAESVKVNDQQNSRHNIRAVTETQRWNSRADSNQIWNMKSSDKSIENTIPSGSCSTSTDHDISQEETNMAYQTYNCHPVYTNIGQRGDAIDSSRPSQAVQAVILPSTPRGSNISCEKMPDRYTWRGT